MHLDLKVAILRSGRTQRRLSIDTEIPETRLSDLVRGRAWPSSTERSALHRELGADYFGVTEDAVASVSASLETARARG